MIKIEKKKNARLRGRKHIVNKDLKQAIDNPYLSSLSFRGVKNQLEETLQKNQKIENNLKNIELEKQAIQVKINQMNSKYNLNKSQNVLTNTEASIFDNSSRSNYEDEAINMNRRIKINVSRSNALK